VNAAATHEDMAWLQRLTGRCVYVTRRWAATEWWVRQAGSMTRAWSVEMQTVDVVLPFTAPSTLSTSEPVRTTACVGTDTTRTRRSASAQARTHAQMDGQPENIMSSVRLDERLPEL